LSNGKNLAAVMLILTVIKDQLQILFTHRTDTVSTHKDQVSLPGGLKEKNDKNLIQTAIRETNEEIGILFHEDEIIGTLPLMESISNYQIQPFICFKENIEQPVINEDEVKHIFMIPIDWILNNTNWNYQIIKTSDHKERNVIVFQPYQSEVVWGITAQIMVSFSNRLLWETKRGDS
jgi:8-oxo-dGTP pyrophosphatase MutT (NUDIX family)